MGLRGNYLLYFKHSKAKTMEIIDEISEGIYKILVNDSKTMKSLPTRCNKMYSESINSP